jgi:uncharacterized membrane protein YdbT with pleckstrin-like domain
MNNDNPVLIPYGDRRIAFDRAPVWLVNLPVFLRDIVLLLLMIFAAAFAASRQHPSPWIVSFSLVAALIWILSTLAYRVVSTACTRIIIDNERLTWREGILERRVISVELYRIQNVEARMAWWQRLAGFGTLIIESSDAAYPTWVLPGIPDVDGLREALIRYAIAMREVKGVREINTGKV